MLGVVVPAYGIPEETVQRFVRVLEMTNWSYPHFLWVQRECPKKDCRGAARNAGIARFWGRCDKVVCIDVDMLVPPGLLAWVDGAVRKGKAVLVYCRYVSWKEGDELKWDDWSELKLKWDGVGGCIGMTMEDWILLGGYDERMTGWGYEDVDLWERARRIGIERVENHWLPLVHVEHWELRNSGRDPKDRKTSALNREVAKKPVFENFLWNRIARLHGLTRIPKVVHQIWIGGKVMPLKWMDTWQRMHPGWEYRLWTWDDLIRLGMLNEELFKIWPDFCGRSDIARYEILWRYGGVYVDADMECLKPLGREFLKHSFWSVWENEVMRPGLVNPAIIGAEPGNGVLRECVLGLATRRRGIRNLREASWKVVGTKYFTEVVSRFEGEVKIYPSGYFFPEHFDGVGGLESEMAYARHYWGTTKGLYVNNPFV